MRFIHKIFHKRFSIVFFFFLAKQNVQIPNSGRRGVGHVSVLDAIITFWLKRRLARSLALSLPSLIKTPPWLDDRIIPAGPLCSYQLARGAVRESNSAQGEGGHEEKEEEEEEEAEEEKK